ncbi:MAG: DUF4136 domain-containing protein [Bacteroidales bacterium]
MKKKFVFYLSIIMLMVSCYPNGAEYYEDLDIVYTNYDDQFDFASQGVYSIPDNIVKIEGDLAEGEDPEFVKEPYNTQILNSINSHMEALGWTATEDPDNADLVLFPAVWTNTTVYYWYDYWCWYYPYYCGWGWGYPSVSSYTSGTLLMTLVADGQEYIEPIRVWTCAINGLLSGSYNTTRVINAIDQAFEQSPYLKTN